jgi:hypothetical protein
MALPDTSKCFRGLSGVLPVRMPADASPASCRRELGAFFGAHPSQVHLLGEDVDGTSVLVCESYKKTCAACDVRLECSCQKEAAACECVRAQRDTGAESDEELCNYCTQREVCCGHEECQCYNESDSNLWDDATPRFR